VNLEVEAYAGELSNLRSCVEVIDRHIAVGPLQGNGFDATAERNGLILARNLLIGLLRPAPGLDHSEYRLVPSRSLDKTEDEEFPSMSGELSDEISQAYFDAKGPLLMRCNL